MSLVMQQWLVCIIKLAGQGFPKVLPCEHRLRTLRNGTIKFALQWCNRAQVSLPCRGMTPWAQGRMRQAPSWRQPHPSSRIPCRQPTQRCCSTLRIPSAASTAPSTSSTPLRRGNARQDYLAASPSHVSMYVTQCGCLDIEECILCPC